MEQSIQINITDLEGIFQSIFSGFKPLIDNYLASKPKIDSGEKDIMNVEDVKNLLNITEPTIDNLVEMGTIKKYKFPNARKVYFLRSQIMEALLNNQIK